MVAIRAGRGGLKRAKGRHGSLDAHPRRWKLQRDPDILREEDDLDMVENSSEFLPV